MTQDEKQVAAIEEYDGYFLLGDEFGLPANASDDAVESKIAEVSVWANGLPDSQRLRVIAALLRTSGNAYPGR